MKQKLETLLNPFSVTSNVLRDCYHVIQVISVFGRSTYFVTNIMTNLMLILDENFISNDFKDADFSDVIGKYLYVLSLYF